MDSYQAPQTGGGSPPKIPSPDPRAHRTKLLQQLDAIGQQVLARPEKARDELASREIIAVRPALNARLVADQLDDTRSDARLIGVVPETGIVLLDVASAELDYFRKKLAAFVDDSKIKTTDKNGTKTNHRANENAVAPVGAIGLAALKDIGGARLLAEALVVDRLYWFEIACRGGYRCSPSDTEGSRAQVARQLHCLGAWQKLDEFIGPEQVYFFVRLTLHQLDVLRSTTDCIYEVELASPPLRDLKLLEDLTTRDVKNFVLKAPGPDAPSVVVLDTGIATEHPLLKSAILSATSAGPEIPSVEDTYGHGTNMAGLALHSDLGAAIERGGSEASHWLQSSRLLVAPGRGTASDENYEKWPVLTLGAVCAAEDADPRPRDRVFTLAVTRSMQDPPFDGPVPTLWSHAVDQIAFCNGQGRLMVVSAGNARERQWLALAEQHPQLQLSEKIHEPAQATNAITVGAYTERVELPHGLHYAEYRIVAPRSGGISPFTSTGPSGNGPIKPEIVMEGGNLAVSGALYDSGIDTLSALTTQKTQIAGRPLTTLNMTSEAAARASHLAARIWSLEPKLWPESVRALIVHSATWTPTMLEQFGGLNDRLLACGYGVPNERIASECAQGLATVIVEDVMPNAVIEEEPKKEAPKRPTTKPTDSKVRRKVKLYRLPVPESLLIDSDPDVEIRVTLSYFAEPNKFGRTVFHGLDLKWDMQGPQESEAEFIQRINTMKRPKGSDGRPVKVPKTRSFDWELGIMRRSRGTVQSDRWRGKMSAVVGDKLIAIVPVLGWWEQRSVLRTQEMRFSLVVSIFGPGVYAAIKPRVEAQAVVPIEV